jgi:hypothetical protein
MAATDTHATREELLEAVFSVRFVPRLYNEGQLPLEESLETVVKRIGGCCETAASLRGREPWSRGNSTSAAEADRIITTCCSELRIA